MTSHSLYICILFFINFGFPGSTVVKNLPANAGDTGDLSSILGLGSSLEEVLTTHSHILDWKIPWTEERARLQPMRWQNRLILSLYLSSFSVTLAYAVSLPFATRTILTTPASLLSSFWPPCSPSHPSFPLRGFLLSPLCFLRPTPNTSLPGVKHTVPFPLCVLPRAVLPSLLLLAEHPQYSAIALCWLTQFSSVQSLSHVWLWHHGLQYTKLRCPSPTPRVYSNSCPLSRWYHSTISSSVIPFSSRIQSFPASRSFQKSQFFASGGQSTGISVAAPVLPMNTQDWSQKGWTGWISLQYKGLSRVFCNTIVQKHQFFGSQLSS